jgi:hypothetical protein
MLAAESHRGTLIVKPWLSRLELPRALRTRCVLQPLGFRTVPAAPIPNPTLLPVSTASDVLEANCTQILQFHMWCTKS